MPTLIDLSIAIENDVPADPPYQRPTVTYVGHAASAAMVAGLFPASSPRTFPTARAGRWRACSSRPTTAPISTRPGTTTRR